MSPAPVVSYLHIQAKGGDPGVWRDTGHLRRFLAGRNLATLVGALLATIGAFLSTIIYFQADNPLTREQEQLKASNAELRRLLDQRNRDLQLSAEYLSLTQQQLNQIRMQIANLDAAVATRELGPAGDELASRLVDVRIAVDAANTRLRDIGEQTKKLDQRMSVIEAAILTDPQKAVAVPLLRRDIDAIQQQLSRELETVRAENARAYDLMKWLVGLMALVSLSLIGTAMGNVFKREPAIVKPESPTVASRSTA